MSQKDVPHVPRFVEWRAPLQVTHNDVERAVAVLDRFDFDRAAGMISPRDWPQRAEELAAALAEILHRQSSRIVG